MKHRLGLLPFILIFLLCLCVPACAEGVATQPAAVPTLTDNIVLLFGAEEQEALDALGSPAVLDMQEDRQQKTLWFDCVIGDAPASVALTFYNGVLMACEYSFTDSGEAYLYAAKCRNELTAAFGEKTTYPGVSADGRGYLDDLADVSQLQDMHVYYEDWTPEIEEAAVRQMIGDVEYVRTDLRLELSVYSSEFTSVSMKYMVVRNGLG